MKITAIYKDNSHRMFPATNGLNNIDFDKENGERPIHFIVSADATSKEIGLLKKYIDPKNTDKNAVEEIYWYNTPLIVIMIHTVVPI